MFEVGDVPADGGDGDKKGDLGRTWTAKCPRLVWSVLVSRVVSCRVESSRAQVRVPGVSECEWRTRSGMRCGLSGQPGVYCGGHLLSFTLVPTVKFMSDWALNSENQSGCLCFFSLSGPPPPPNAPNSLSPCLASKGCDRDGGTVKGCSG